MHLTLTLTLHDSCICIFNRARRRAAQEPLRTELNAFPALYSLGVTKTLVCTLETSVAHGLGA